MSARPSGEGVLIALDWGTTNVRAALLDRNGRVLDERRGESGVGVFSSEEFAQNFDKLTAGWPPVPAIAAGMVGSRQGWREANYLACPVSTERLSQSLIGFDHGSHRITIVPGLTYSDADIHDVMRGEETQIAGLLAEQPDFSGIAVLPGTHSKWVRIAKGTVKRFRTYMTGEMFEALSQHTILRHSMNDAGGEWNDAAFEGAASEIFAGGSGWGRFFSIRAGHLLSGGETAYHCERLSGYLIASEFAAARRDGFDDQSIVIIGTGQLVSRYEAAATLLGLQSNTHRGTDLVWPALFNLAGRAGLVGSNVHE